MKLELSGQRIVKVSVDFSITLCTDGGYEIQIAGEFSLLACCERIDFTLTEQGLKPDRFPSLLNQSVTSASADYTGTLILGFDSGTSLRVEPDPDYEAWNITGPRGRMIVCMPGGELAVWSQES
jgi:hypothetical protein